MTDPQSLQLAVQQIEQEMKRCEENGEYIKAHAMKQKASLTKKQIHEQLIFELTQKHKDDLNKLKSELKEKQQQCDNKWKKEITELEDNFSKEQKQIEEKNKKEESIIRREIEEQWPSKVRESHELLNLREMEHHSSKQKDFQEAHRLQVRINQLLQQETRSWNQAKEQKITQALLNQRSKYEQEKELVTRKWEIKKEDETNKWRLEKVALQQRFNLEEKQIKALQERELGSLDNKFRTKGGSFNQKFVS